MIVEIVDGHTTSADTASVLMENGFAERIKNIHFSRFINSGIFYSDRLKE